MNIISDEKTRFTKIWTTELWKRENFSTEPQKKRRNTNSIKLLRKLMANKEFLVTLDESWMHFRKSDGQRSLHYVTKGEKPNPDHVYEPNQLHPKQVMMIGIVCGRGPISLKEVPEKTTVDAEYFIKHVLKPLVEEDLPKFYNRRDAKGVYSLWHGSGSHFETHISFHQFCI